MAVIADDVVSYEHEEPLRYVGVDAVRELCQRNLDAAPGETAVSWTVPDLKILVRGDLAVAWGLNHVRIEPPDAPAIDSWSRGTRVFERRNGTWLLTHQHLSVPYSPPPARPEPTSSPDPSRQEPLIMKLATDFPSSGVANFMINEGRRPVGGRPGVTGGR